MKPHLSCFLYVKLGFSFIAFLILNACQIKPKPIEKAAGERWYASARLGNWDDFEKLQTQLNRPWDFQGPNQVDALMVASRNGQISFVQKLLEKKAKINQLDKFKYNALSYALHGPSPVETKKQICLLLISNGADPFAEDHLKTSPILYMIENGYFECVKEVKLSNFAPCDQLKRLSEVTSLVVYAEKEEEFEIRDYLKSKGCE